MDAAVKRDKCNRLAVIISLSVYLMILCSQILEELISWTFSNTLTLKQRDSDISLNCNCVIV